MKHWIQWAFSFFQSLSKELIKKSKTRIIAISKSHGFITALEFNPFTKTFLRLSPLDPVLESKEDLLLVSLPTEEIFYGKIAGLPLSFKQELFHKKERIESQIAQKVLWDLTPYSYTYGFQKSDAKKVDLFFALASLDHLQECKSYWEKQGISPSVITTPFAILANYLDFYAISFPATIFLKKDNHIERYEFTNAQDVSLTILTEKDLLSLSNKTDSAPNNSPNSNSGSDSSKVVTFSNFESPYLEVDFVDHDLFLKGLGLSAISPPKPWAKISLVKQMSSFFPLKFALGEKLQKATFAFLGLALLFTSARFVSFTQELDHLNVELSFWQVAKEKEILERQFTSFQLAASMAPSLHEKTYSKSIERIESLLNDFHPLSVKLDDKHIEIVLAAPSDMLVKKGDDLDLDGLELLVRQELLQKIEKLDGTLLQEDRDLYVVSFPVGPL